MTTRTPELIDSYIENAEAVVEVLASFIGTTFIEGLCIAVTVIHWFAIWPAAKGRNTWNRVSPGLELI
jgi:hypothetical protein